MSIELVEENQRQAPVERPTVGRRLYYWSDVLNGVVDNMQPFDAGVLYVHPDGKVNLMVTTHEGAQRVMRGVEVFNPPRGEDLDHHGWQSYATWMPFQRKQQQAAPEAAALNAQQAYGTTLSAHEPGAGLPAPAEGALQGAGFATLGEAITGNANTQQTTEGGAS